MDSPPQMDFLWSPESTGFHIDRKDCWSNQGHKGLMTIVRDSYLVDRIFLAHPLRMDCSATCYCRGSRLVRMDC